MATAAVDNQRCHPSHLHLESLPLVDLRLISQSELLSLSACSSDSSASLPNADTDLITPKIDRSVFNESAGSRKQTFYRLRLGAPRNNFSPSKPSAAPVDEPLGEENPQVVGLLKSLFNIPSEIPSVDIQEEEEDLVPVQIEYAGRFCLPSTEQNLAETLTETLTETATAVQEDIQVGVVDSSTAKRKRGRGRGKPPKEETGSLMIQSGAMAIEGIQTPIASGTATENVISNANVGDLSSCSDGKKKRGRPRKEATSNSLIQKASMDATSNSLIQGASVDARSNSLIQGASMEIDGIKTPMAVGSTNEKVASDANVGIQTPVACGATIEKVKSDVNVGVLSSGGQQQAKDETSNFLIQRAAVNTEVMSMPVAGGTTSEKVILDANVGVLSGGGVQKKKRGRPFKNENSKSSIKRASMKIEVSKTPVTSGTANNLLVQGAPMVAEGIKTPMTCGTANSLLVQGAPMVAEGIKTPMTCGTANSLLVQGAPMVAEGIKTPMTCGTANNSSNQGDPMGTEGIKTPMTCGIANNSLIQGGASMEVEGFKTPMLCGTVNENVNTNAKVGAPSSFSEGKKKRGRPRKNETGNRLTQSGNKESGESVTPMTCQSANENGNTNANVGDMTDGSERKKKRGRPPKSEISKRTVKSKESNIDNSQNGSKTATVMPGDSKEKETVDVNDDLKVKMVYVDDEAVDLVEVRKADDFLKDELRRRTDGLGTEAELLEFLKRLDGEWATKTEKKRIVDARNFCNMLPQGWKLMLCVRKRATNAWLACRRYISRSGRQLVTSKDVSLYLLTVFGPRETSGKNPVLPADQADLAIKPTSKNLPTTANSAEHAKQSQHEKESVLLNVKNTKVKVTQKSAAIKCHKCTMTFNQQDEFIGHLISSHQGSAKELGHGTSINIEHSGGNGNYECQHCKEQFKEWHHYNSHLEVHSENYKKKIEGSAGTSTLPKGSQPSLFGVPFAGSNMDKRTVADLDSATKDVGTNVYSMEGKREYNTGPFNMRGNEKTFSSQSSEKRDATSITREFEFNTVHHAVKDDSKSGSSNFHSVPAPAVNDEMKRSCSPGIFPSRNVNRDDVTDGRKGTTKSGGSNFYSEPAATMNDEMKKSCSAGLFPSRNVNRVDVTDGIKGTSTPVAVDSPWAVSHFGEQGRVINSTSNLVSKKMKDEPETFACSKYQNKGSFHSASNDNLKKPLQQKEMEAGLSTEQVFSYYSNVDRSSSGTIAVPKPKEAQSSAGFIHAVGSNNNAFNANFGASAEPGRAKEGSFPVPNVNKQAFNSTIKEIRQDRGQSSVPQSLNNDPRTNKTDLNVGYWGDSFHNKTDAGIFTGNEQKSSSFLATNEQRYACKNDVPGVGGGSFHEVQQKKGIFTDNEQRSSSFLAANEQKFARKNDVPGVGGGSFHELPQKKGIFTGNEQRSSSFLAANEQKFSCKNDVPGAGGGSFHELQQKKNLLDDLFGFSGNEQTHLENNLNVACTEPVQDGPRFGGFKNANSNGVMIGFGNNACPGGDAMPDFMWKSDDEHGFLNGLSESSSQLFQPSAQYPAFDGRPNKGASEYNEKFSSAPGFQGLNVNEKYNSAPGFEGLNVNEKYHSAPGFQGHNVNEKFNRAPGFQGLNVNEKFNSAPGFQGLNVKEKFDSAPGFQGHNVNGKFNSAPGFQGHNVNEKFNSAPGFQGLRPGSYDHMEYNFLNAQTGSNSQNSKAPTYNPQMTLGFDSSAWFEKEALPLLPKATQRNQVSVCYWCGNQFHNEAIGSEADKGLAGPMCPNCRVRFSTNRNFF